MFNLNNINNSYNNLKKEGNVQVKQDKGSGIVVLNTNHYEEKVEDPINRSFFDKHDSDRSSGFKQTVIDWIESGQKK